MKNILRTLNSSIQARSLIYYPQFHFARAGSKTKPASVSKRIEEVASKREEIMEQWEQQESMKAAEEEVRSDPAYGFGEKREQDKNYADYSPLSDNTLPIDKIPDEITRRMRKIFSKHEVKDVREWGSLLIKNYQLLHAIEKPMNLQYVKPFANTSDLVNKTPKIHVDEAKQKKEEEKKIKEKEQSKSKQPQEESTIEMEQTDDSAGFKAKDPEKKSRSEQNEESEKQEFYLNYQREHAIAYLYKKMPYHFMVYKRILHEVFQRMPNFKPESLLDYGAGLGSGLWAGQTIFNQSLKRVAAVEPNVNMRKLGKYLTEEVNEKCNNSILWVDSLAMIPGVGGEKGKFDIIILGFVLQEVPTAAQRQMLIEALWLRVKENGVFIVVEPGSPKGYRFINSFRDWIIAKDRAEANIVAPCPHHNVCPLASNPDTWCHFSQISHKIPNTIFPKIHKERDLNNEKFSFLVVKKGSTPSQELEKEEDAKNAYERSYFWPRLIRPIIRKHKHLIMDLCNSKGNIERRIIAKSHGIEGGFRKAKKARWGDLWYFEKRVPHKFRKEGRYGKRLW